MGNCKSCHKHNSGDIKYEAVGCCLCQPKGGPGIKKNLFQRQTCKSNEDKNGALCYPKCKSGYKAKGCCICEPDGGPGIKQTLFNRQYCKADEDKSGALCYPRCKTKIIDGKSVKHHAKGCCLCEPEGGPRIVKTAFDRYQCKEGEELNGALCYPKCKTKKIDGKDVKHHAKGCCLCEPEGGPRIAKTAFDRYQCKEDEVLRGALCYPKCRAGYRESTVNICERSAKDHCEDNKGKGNCEQWGALWYPKCKKGSRIIMGTQWDFAGYSAPKNKIRFVNEKLSNHLGGATKSVSLTNDEWNDISNGTSPTMDSYVESSAGNFFVPSKRWDYKAVGCCLCEPGGGPRITMTAFDRYMCRPDEELNGALCYPKCKEGFSNAGCCLCDFSKDLKWLTKRGIIDSCNEPDFPTFRNGMCHYKPPDSTEAPFGHFSIGEMRANVHEKIDALFEKKCNATDKRDREYCDANYGETGKHRTRCDASHPKHDTALAECAATCGVCTVADVDSGTPELTQEEAPVLVDETGDALAATDDTGAGDDGVALEEGFANDEVLSSDDNAIATPPLGEDAEEPGNNVAVAVRLVILATILFLVFKPSPASKNKK